MAIYLASIFFESCSCLWLQRGGLFEEVLLSGQAPLSYPTLFRLWHVTLRKSEFSAFHLLVIVSLVLLTAEGLSPLFDFNTTTPLQLSPYSPANEQALNLDMSTPWAASDPLYSPFLSATSLSLTLPGIQEDDEISEETLELFRGSDSEDEPLVFTKNGGPASQARGTSWTPVEESSQSGSVQAKEGNAQRKRGSRTKPTPQPPNKRPRVSSRPRSVPKTVLKNLKVGNPSDGNSRNAGHNATKVMDLSSISSATVFTK